MTFADLSEVIFRRWKWLLAAAVVGAMVGFAVGKVLIKPAYTATTAVVLKPVTDEGGQSLLERAPSYAQLVTASRVLRPVETALRMDLTDKVSGTYGDGTFLVLISATDSDSLRVVAVADGVAKSYAEQMSKGFGGAVPSFMRVDAQVVERADNVSPAGKLSPKLLAPTGALLAPLCVLALSLASARRRRARSELEERMVSR